MKKTIKIIDLYYEVANGEIIPLNIKHNGRKYHFDTSDNEYYDVEENKPTLLERISRGNVYAWLNSEVEILDEEEFEYIEEKNVYMNFSCNYWKQAQIDELTDTLTRYELAIKKIIRNQKKIIEKLNKSNNTQ